MRNSAALRTTVITGVGCVTPIGHDVPSFWRAVLAGASGADRVRSFDPSPFSTRVGCEVRAFREPRWTRCPAGGADRTSSLALVAAVEALESAGLPVRSSGSQLAKAALSVGTTMGAPSFLDSLASPPATEPDPLDAPESPVWDEVLRSSAWSITENVAAELGIGGPQVSLPAACSAGNYAIGFASDLIRHGEAEIAVAGGGEAFSQSAYAGFDRLRAMSPDVCRPFDRNRRGLLLGEGAGMLVLESEEHARRRGAPILARVLGYGLSCDAYHITGPHPEGAGAAAAMRRAFEDARIESSAVGYISCHGTGTRQNDRIETLAIRRACGADADRIPVSSLKALTGHMLGAASAVEAIACVLAIRDGVLPPTWNIAEQDPECDLDVIPRGPREVRADVVLNNSYAFGGNNACLVLGRW